MQRRNKLTAKFVNTLKPEVKAYPIWDTEISGFPVRVHPTGRKTYALGYRHAGIWKKYTIDVHGNVTADGARLIAKKKTGEVADGTDIQADKKNKRNAQLQRYRTLKHHANS